MPVQSETSRIQYTGNASTVTPYPVPFYFLANADVIVVVTDGDGGETVLTETTDYTITGALDVAGGEIITVAAVPDTSTLTIYRDPEATQLSQFQGTGPLPATALTQGLDRVTMLVQSLLRKVGRCFRFTDSSESVGSIPGTGRASKVLGFDGLGGAKLYDSAGLLSMLSLSGSLTEAPTAFWSDDGERSAKVPDFVNQVGVQSDNRTVWISTGVGAGQWAAYTLDEDDLVSDSPVSPPSQQSVKAYVDAGDAAVVAASSAEASAKDAAYLPPGVIASYAGAAAPAGWLLCYGQAVSRTTYAALFTAIGTTYGTGDGSSTFTLPDMRGRAVAGKDDMGGVAASRITASGTGNPGVDGANLGAAGGVDRHTLTTAQMAAHRHWVVAAEGASTTVGLTSANQICQTRFVAGDYAYGMESAATATDATVGRSSSTGSSEAHPQLQPTIILNYIIRT
jgi:microcystin-dependent protein